MSGVEMSPEGLPELFAALAKAQGEMTVANKDREVTEKRKTKDGRQFSTKRSYATLESVTDATRPILSKHGLCLMQHPETDDRGRVVMHTIIGHSGGGWIRSSMTGSTEGLQQRGVQALGSVITYLRRYTWMAACGIAQADDDDDGQSGAQAARHDRRPPPRREEPTARPDTAPKGEHHPDWKAGANRWFFAQLGDMEIDYATQLAPWHQEQHGTRPSQLSRRVLDDLVRHLRTTPGLVDVLKQRGAA